ncbi:MAG: hypothetical protein U5R31_14920 [Acidimicrobiia bacterium]|nr:hypothetical protein [Acidimicrobiia bacterium]
MGIGHRSWNPLRLVQDVVGFAASWYATKEDAAVWNDRKPQEPDDYPHQTDATLACFRERVRGVRVLTGGGGRGGRGDTRRPRERMTRGRADRLRGTPTTATTPGRPRPRPGRATVLMVAAFLVLAACTSGSDYEAASDPQPDRPSVDVDGASTLPEDVEVDAGTREVTVTGVEPGARVHLLAQDGAALVTGIADELGQLHTAYVPDDYTVRRHERRGRPTRPRTAGRWHPARTGWRSAHPTTPR